MKLKLILVCLVVSLLFSFTVIAQDITITCPPLVSKDQSFDCAISFNSDQSFMNFEADVSYVPNLFFTIGTVSSLPTATGILFEDLTNGNKLIIADSAAVGVTQKQIMKVSFKAVSEGKGNIILSNFVAGYLEGINQKDITLQKSYSSNEIEVKATVAPVCDNDKTCDAGETNTNCPGDCPVAGGGQAQPSASGTVGAGLDAALKDSATGKVPTVDDLKKSGWTAELISKLANFFKGIFGSS